MLGNVAAWVLVLSMPAAAQWLDYPTPGIPRTHAPRTAEGKPNLSGVWEHLNARTTADYPDGIDIPWQPWAAAVFRQRIDDNQLDNLESKYLPRGIPRADAFDVHEIVQMPGLALILYEYQTTFRPIFTDGRKLPENPNPTWMGYSLGHWEEDTLDIQLTIDDPKTYTKPWKAERLECVCNENERDVRHLVGK